MLDDFDVQGYWWLSGEKEYDIPGNLYSEDGSYYLEILGSFTDALLTTSEYDYIYGFTVKGEKITLLNSMGLGISFNSPGMSTEKLFIGSFIVGEHLSAIEKQEFHSVDIVMTHSTNWFNTRPFEITTQTDKETNTLLKDTTTFIPPSTNNYYVPFLGANISSNYNYSSRHNFVKGLSSEYIESFKVTPDKKQDYNWFDNVIKSINRLLILLINETSDFEKITFFGNQKNIQGTDLKTREKYYLYFSYRKRDIQKSLDTRKMLFTFQDVQDKLNIILDNWFEKEAELENVYNLYFSDFFNKNENMETKFLNATQTLEVFHRSMGHGKLFSDEERDSYIEAINEAIKDHLPESIYSEVNQKLKYFNEYSLSKRLRDIGNDLNKETKKFLFEKNRNSRDFFHKVVMTRNYLTHYGEQTPKKFKGFESYYATIILKVLSGILLFKELGMKEEEILEAMMSNSDLSFRVKDAKANLGLDSSRKDYK